MPANLTPDYLEAEKRWREAKTPPEKLEALRDMLALIPKHKGTEKMQADIKHRIAKLQDQIARSKQKVVKTTSLDHVEREGAGQVALVGLPNSGKSSLLKAVTHAEPGIADYPFSTFKPLPGMMEFEDVQIQLVDLPPISENFTEPWVYSIIRRADLAVLIVDLSADDPGEDAMTAMELLEGSRIRLVGTAESRAPSRGVMPKRGIIIGTKLDAEGADREFEALRRLYDGELDAIAVSSITGTNLDGMRRAIFDSLGIIRVYTKRPGRKPDKDRPYILPRGSTVMDVARTIHKDFAEKMRFARLWGSGEFEGQQVHRDHVLEDGDVIELHI